MRLFLRSAAGQDLRVVAELPRAGAEGEMSVQPLAAGGPPFVVCVGPAVVNVWPVGRGSEPVVSVLPGAYSYSYPYPRAPAFGDFDGDGLLDLAVIADGSIAVLRGDGTGRFTSAATLVTDSRLSQLAAGDFDGNGRPDLVVASGSRSGVSVWRSAGDGTFTLQTQSPQGSGATTPISRFSRTSTATAFPRSSTGRSGCSCLFP